jgi:carbonic anhydrase
VADGRLRIHGWRFDLTEGNMYVYVPENDQFEPLNMDLAEKMQGL